MCLGNALNRRNGFLTPWIIVCFTTLEIDNLNKKFAVVYEGGLKSFRPQREDSSTSK